MAPFSRLQLAAALIEYDNDDSDPTAPRRSAQESAIFAHLRRANGPRRSSAARRSTDYLGVALPSETGSMIARDSVAGGRESVFDDRRSRASIDALRNPFGRDSTYEGILGEEDEEEELEVDLTSWGLDALLPEDKDKVPKSTHKRAKTDSLPNPHPDVAGDRPTGLRSELGRRSTPAARTMSMGNFDSFGEGGAFLEANSTMRSLGARRHSIGAPLDFSPVRQPVEERSHRGRAPSSHALIENIPPTPPLHSIPFPTSESVRSISPMPGEGASIMRPSSRASENILNSAHGRTYSTASLGSQMLLSEKEPNPFAVRPPSPDRASRFDPKARARTMSQGSMGTMLSPGVNEDEPNPFSLRPPSPSRSSRFDPKVRARTMSNGSFGTQMLLDNDARSSNGDAQSSRPRLYSRLELMRPKVLIMPSPLQSAVPTAPSTTRLRTTGGFELDDDGPPLPPGARAARRSSTTLSMLEPTPGLVASNSFTPNPRDSLTLSQLTFRNTLAVDGQRDPAYADIDSRLRRATEDGEQITEEPEFEPAPSTPMPMPAIVVDPADRSKRPAGKLYGKSLIDSLEERKAAMRSKQRVFTGDERPSMMARTPMKRSSTLIDPESLKQRPQSQRMNSSRSQPTLSRRNSANTKTLLEFEDEIPGARQSQHLGVIDATTPGNKRSVFGVDTLWERELAKLREIEESERIEAEAEAKREAEEKAKNERKGKGKGKKGKRKGKNADLGAASVVPESTSDLAVASAAEPRAPSPPYVLPTIERTAARRRPPPPGDDISDGDSDSDNAQVPNNRQTIAKDIEADEWVAGSSDEEDRGRRRSTVLGPRFTNDASAAPKLVKHDDDSSEEDIPLVATIGRAARRMTRVGQRDDDDSDEEKPLSTLLDKTKLRLPSTGSFGGSLFPDSSLKSERDEEEDDKPLGLRVSRIVNSSQALSQEADDDKPLALHPEQLRRTQYMMAQQQQQQLMMQAQAAQYHQSMIFSTPSMMASGFFGPPMPPPMMMPAQLPGPPPPMNDVAKFGRVDKWRHDVAVEGEP